MKDGRTLVIADPGCTHEGNFGAMMSLVDLAALAGADACKFQWTSDPVELAARRDAADYLPYYQWLAFPREWHAILAARCGAVGIRYACTAYLPQDVEVVAPHTDFFKVSSFESGSGSLMRAYLSAMAGNEKRLIVSLGFGQQRTDAALPVDEESWKSRVDFLHCVSAYPTPDDQLALPRIRGLDGFSDHSDPTNAATGALAVAAGARIVERHIRLEWCKASNPDYAVSMSAHGFASYVRGVRLAEVARMDAAFHAGAAPAEQPMARHRVGSRFRTGS